MPGTGKRKKRGKRAATTSKAKRKTAQAKTVRLASLKGGMLGLTPSIGGTLVEAAEVCLNHNKHTPNVSLEIAGAFSAASTLAFGKCTAQTRRAHADLQEATERGATAVAICVVCEETDYEVVERSAKGAGFDYWLGTDVAVFEARLEVSGILTGTETQIAARVKEKLRQMTPSDAGGLPGYAAVVEFGAPKIQVEAK